MNIYELIRGRRQYLQEQRIKHYMWQLLKSMDHMHRNGIFHRDIKPENILITDDELKLADFGSCRGIYSKQPYTEYISTRWYRAPECLLTDGFYNYKMDMWGVGCVFFEVLSLYPLFPGTNELDQVTKIHAVLGTPPQETLAKLKKHSNSHIDFNFPHKEPQIMAKLIPHCSPDCVDIITKLLAYDPDDRLSARQAVKHPYFKDLRATELKEKQAAAREGGADEADGDSAVTASTAGSTARSSKKALAAEGAGSSMLPSIDKASVTRSHKHSKELPADGPSDLEATTQQAGDTSAMGLPNLQPPPDDSGSSGMLPPIGGGGHATHGQVSVGQGGVPALKIDSKSLMAAPPKGQAAGGALGKMKQHKAAAKPSGFKGGPATHPKGGLVGSAVAGSAVQMQSRSCASCGDVLDFGCAGSSAAHASQPSMEPVDHAGSKTRKYQSPYKGPQATKKH